MCFLENRQKTQSFIQFGESFDFLLEDPVKRGGPPSLSFSNLASDSIDSACDNPKYLAESIGSLSLTDSAYDDNEEAKVCTKIMFLNLSQIVIDFVDVAGDHYIHRFLPRKVFELTHLEFTLMQN